jgi:hypothetical protein
MTLRSSPRTRTGLSRLTAIPWIVGALSRHGGCDDVPAALARSSPCLRRRSASSVAFRNHRGGQQRGGPSRWHSGSRRAIRAREPGGAPCARSARGHLPARDDGDGASHRTARSGALRADPQGAPALRRSVRGDRPSSSGRSRHRSPRLRVRHPVRLGRARRAHLRGVARADGRERFLGLWLALFSDRFDSGRPTWASRARKNPDHTDRSRTSGKYFRSRSRSSMSDV